MKERVIRRRLADGTLKEYRYSARRTVGTVATEYRRSSEWADLGAETRRAYEANLLRIEEVFGAVEIEGIALAHVMGLRDSFKGQPATANKLFGVFSVLLTFAMRRGYIKHHPLAGARIKKLRQGEHRRWPGSAIAYAIENLPPYVARGVMLAVYTGQREGDCVARRWSEVQDGGFLMKQQKTGAELWVPIHPDLAAAMVEWKRDASAVTILQNMNGLPWKGAHTFRHAFCRERDKHPDLAGLTFHGLRKSAAARLAEAGCTEHEIMSITGHKTLSEVQRYTRQARQKTMAKSAMVKLSDYLKK